MMMTVSALTLVVVIHVTMMLMSLLVVNADELGGDNALTALMMLTVAPISFKLFVVLLKSTMRLVQ